MRHHLRLQVRLSVSKTHEVRQRAAMARSKPPSLSLAALDLPSHRYDMLHQSGSIQSCRGDGWTSSRQPNYFDEEFCVANTKGSAGSMVLVLYFLSCLLCAMDFFFQTRR